MTTFPTPPKHALILSHHKQHRTDRSSSTRRRRPEYIPNRFPDDNTFVRIMDTTLRDGLRASGRAMTRPEKLAVAQKLAELGVDVIEVGFPASSEEDLETSKLIAREVGNAGDELGFVPAIAALARCVRGDVDAAWEAVREARWPRLHVFISTSEILMKYKLKKTPEEVLELAKESVGYAKSLGCHDIEFVCVDAGRSNKEFLYRVYGEAIKAGATTITFTDTVGCNFPGEVEQMILNLKANIQGIQDVVIAAHCHNDLGLATANSLAAAQAGARQIEVTINGIGERAGNTSLEEFVMAIESRGDDLLLGLYTGIDTKQIVPISKMVEEYSGLSLQPHKAIVGNNVLSHANGIHQNTYELLSPQDIDELSRTNESSIVLEKQSGPNAAKSRLLEFGFNLDEKQLDVAETNMFVSEEDVDSLVSKHRQSVLAWKLKDVISNQGQGLPTATVKLVDAKGVEHTASSEAVDQVNAVFNAIDLIVKVPVTVVECNTNVATGDDTIWAHVKLSEINSKIQESQNTVSGSARSHYLVECCALAYIDALNQILAFGFQAK